MSTPTSEPAGLHVAEFNNEPSWLQIGWAYLDLHKATHKLADDIGRYNKALQELDGAGTAIANGKDRIFELREEIARIEATK
jgi:hypothetical protein